MNAARLLAPVVSTLAVCAYGLVGRSRLDPDASWPERLHRRWLPTLAAPAERWLPGTAAREVSEDEYALTLPLPPERVDRRLHERGFVRHPLARVKTREGVESVGSWVLLDHLLAPRMLHAMLFASEDGGATHVYAHEEYSSLNPLVAYAHYAGDGQSAAAGVARVRELLA
ncbi:hypothetical protein ACFQPA_04440 [Halomarina halobia]|uniref:Uncharacterized protein n=1 Tax=Halomarina halobia TaxID=3033386 RepID=A0ABD6A5H4_9EURY|nr:hypothetical protein [Halomarina sp. PSR21]